MPGPLYEEMTAAQAADALDEFLAERGPALARLRAILTRDGIPARRLLTGSLTSVTRVWDWITARAAANGVAAWPLDQDPTREAWPSWARHGMLVDPHPPAATPVLVDGFASYLAGILTTAVPAVHWQVGEHRLEDYPMTHYPVLAAGHHQVFLPGLPLYSVYQSAHGRDPIDGHEMGAHVQATMAALAANGPAAEAAQEPSVTVVAEVDCFDIGLRADLPARPGLVERLIAELAERDGVQSVYRYGADALIITTPTWSDIRLKLWLTLWLQRNLLPGH